MNSEAYRSFLVAAGGVGGCLARYWMSGLVQRISGGQFPFGTLSVNVLGSFVVGVIMTLSLERGQIGAELRILLTVGFCGGFTTMSTFSYESVALMRDGTAQLALYNLASTLTGCLGAAWLAVRLVRWF